MNPGSAATDTSRSGNHWLPFVCFVAAAFSQWPPVVTHEYVRTDVFVLTILIASVARINVAAGVAGAVTGSAAVLAITNLDQRLALDLGIAIALSVLVGLFYRYLLSRVIWRQSWLGFLIVTLTVVLACLAASAAEQAIAGDWLSWRIIAQRSLPLVIAAMLAGGWVFVGHSRRTDQINARGWPVAFAVVAAAVMAGQGFLITWIAQEQAELSTASQTLIQEFAQVTATDQNSFTTAYLTAPAVPFSDLDQFSQAMTPLFIGSDALIASGLLEKQGNDFTMKYVVDRQGNAADQVAEQLGGAPADQSVVNGVSEHQTLLGLRPISLDGKPDSSVLSVVYAAPQAVPPGSPAQILTVAESLPGAFDKTVQLSTGIPVEELHLVLALGPSKANPNGLVVAEHGTEAGSYDRDVTAVTASVPIGNDTLVFTTSPGVGFGVDENIRRLTWLGLLLLAGSTLLVYFRGLMASDAIEESEHRYRLLAENSADVVLQHSGPEHTVTWVSPSLTGVLGWQPADLIGKPLGDFIHPDDRVGGAALIAAAQKYQDVAASGEIRFATATATQWRWMSAATKTVAGRKSISAAESGIVSLRDIQDSVDSRMALEKSESLFRTSMESAAIGMAIVRLDGSFVVVNQSLCSMLKYGESSLLAMNVSELVHDESMVHVRELGAQMVGNDFDSIVEQLRLVRSDHVEVWARTAVARVPSAGEPHDVYLLQVEDITDEREARNLLAFRAFHDPLTGLRNRAWILDSLATDLESAGRKGAAVGVLFVDLDHFKVVNDSLGHAAGDDYLVTVAERIKGSLRAIDRVGRFGGDEFVVVFPDVDNPRQLENAAERISTALGADLHLRGHRMVPSASIGIALSTPASTPDSLLRDADSALYRAKYAGRARWQFFDKQMHEQALSRLTTEDELRDAIERNEFVVHYQPIVAFADSQIAGYEALIRWEHPTAGLMMPGSFLDVAEASGLIAGIGPLVLEKVCQDIADRPEFTGHVSINVSAVELAQANWGKNFNAVINRHVIDPSRLIIEVTETAVMEMLPTTKTSIRALTSRGVGLHLDDFGTGFSSISILRDLPVTGVKLDRRFVQDVSSGEGSANALSRGLAGLVSGLDLAGIAEGVESSLQASILAEQGWGFGQGYYFGRPGPLPERSDVATVSGHR